RDRPPPPPRRIPAADASSARGMAIRLTVRPRRLLFIAVARIAVGLRQRAPPLLWPRLSLLVRHLGPLIVVSTAARRLRRPSALPSRITHPRLLFSITR